MLGPWKSWQLLLGWALLLGQPVAGDSNATQEFSSQEPEELEPVSEEPMELGPVSEEPMELGPVSEESEWPTPESEEPGWEKMTSDEILEYDENERRKRMQDRLSMPWNYELQYLRGDALEHHHKHSTEFYVPFDNANLRIEKAIGTMIYLQMALVKTNCTNDQQAKEENSDHSYYHRLYHADRYPRNCEPEENAAFNIFEIQDCTFTFFEDARDPGNPVIFNQKCHHFHENLGRRRYLPPGLFENY